MMPTHGGPTRGLDWYSRFMAEACDQAKKSMLNGRKWAELGYPDRVSTNGLLIEEILYMVVVRFECSKKWQPVHK